MVVAARPQNDQGIHSAALHKETRPRAYFQACVPCSGQRRLYGFTGRLVRPVDALGHRAPPGPTAPQEEPPGPPQGAAAAAAIVQPASLVAPIACLCSVHVAAAAIGAWLYAITGAQKPDAHEAVRRRSAPASIATYMQVLQISTGSGEKISS